MYKHEQHNNDTTTAAAPQHWQWSCLELEWQTDSQHVVVLAYLSDNSIQNKQYQLSVLTANKTPSLDTARQLEQDDISLDM